MSASHPCVNALLLRHLHVVELAPRPASSEKGVLEDGGARFANGGCGVAARDRAYDEARAERREKGGRPCAPPRRVHGEDALVQLTDEADLAELEAHVGRRHELDRAAPHRGWHSNPSRHERLALLVERVAELHQLGVQPVAPAPSASAQCPGRRHCARLCRRLIRKPRRIGAFGVQTASVCSRCCIICHCRCRRLCSCCCCSCGSSAAVAAALAANGLNGLIELLLHPHRSAREQRLCVPCADQILPLGWPAIWCKRGQGVALSKKRLLFLHAKLELPWIHPGKQPCRARMVNAAVPERSLQ